MIGKLAVPALQWPSAHGWKPTMLVYNSLASRDEVVSKVGFDKMVGTIAMGTFKDPADPRWKDDKAVIEFKKFMHEYYPTVSENNLYAVKGYFAAQLLEAILKKAGDNLTRKNIMNIATNMNYTSDDFPILLPGIEIKTSPTDYGMYSKMIPLKFDGESWVPVDPTP
jgi:branched-chain amino acid transport system substrate-binding protein